MKIIAKGIHGFLVEGTENEICNMAGFYSSYSNQDIKVEIGKEFPVAEIFQNAKSVLEGFSNIQKDFDAAKDKVSKLLALMAPITPKKTKS